MVYNLQGGVMPKLFKSIIYSICDYILINGHILKNLIRNILGYKKSVEHNIVLDITAGGKCYLVSCTCGKLFLQRTE